MAYADRRQDVEGEHALGERRVFVPQPWPPRQEPFARRVLHPESRGRDRVLACGRDVVVRDREKRDRPEADRS